MAQCGSNIPCTYIYIKQSKIYFLSFSILLYLFILSVGVKVKFILVFKTTCYICSHLSLLKLKMNKQNIELKCIINDFSLLTEVLNSTFDGFPIKFQSHIMAIGFTLTYTPNRNRREQWQLCAKDQSYKNIDFKITDVQIKLTNKNEKCIHKIVLKKDESISAYIRFHSGDLKKIPDEFI